MSELQDEVEKRKIWFYECQLRWLNLDNFRSITELDVAKTAKDPFPDRRLDLISEPLFTWGFPAGQIGGKMKKLGQVYLDDQEPVWTDDERSRRDAFAATFIGKMNNWLGYKRGDRLAGKLVELRQKYEASHFSSEIDLDPDVNLFRRRDPGGDLGKMGNAVSRTTLAQLKPWLIPELYNAKNIDTGPIENWIGNLEQFVSDFESNLTVASGGEPSPSIMGGTLKGEAYRTWIKFLMDVSSTRDVADAVKTKMFTQILNKDKSITYRYDDINDIQIEAPGYPMGPVGKFPFSESIKYWTGVMKNSLGEVYVSKANSDMGLCLIMRTIYQLGTMPATLGADTDLVWRKRTPPGDDFAAFFAKKAEDPALKDNDDLRTRLQEAQSKLQTILEETAARPRSADPTFSPLTQEIVRHALHSFKFWIDEPLRTSSNDALKRARGSSKIAKDDEITSEMEYWSENHYIMFASSEFLAGQLWEKDQFQPAQEFLGAKDQKLGILSGKERKERGQARVLKWLNNRLMFGWMEFNSSGYYREHLWALLNLADFSLDREVREKATLAIDLLLFDVARFLHQGTMGAAGGRSQFKSKSSGWDNALCDVVEILFGARGLFSDYDGEIGMSMATSSYKVPDVLLEIGSHPPATPFADRTRVSITFEEAPKYGIGYSKPSDQKDSVMQGYAPKRAQHYPFLDAVNQEIARTHPGYGSTEDDTIFWWGTSAYFNKQIVRGTFDAVDKFGLDQSGIFGSALPGLIKKVAFFEEAKHAVIGGLIGSIFGPIGAVTGAAIGFFKDGVLTAKLEETAADDLSVVIEGSTRTRANIFTFRTPDVMLSSIQNFRPGQFNFQTSVNQASLNPAVNVFTTAGFVDIDISALDAALGGGFLGAALGAALSAATGGVGGVLVAGLGAIGAGAGAIINEAALRNQKTLANHEDGPGWWTGYWALPMIVQHESAAIFAYDFHSIQNLLSVSGSHVWFPKAGFDRVDEMRTSAYDDANFPLLDIGDIGPKGFWLFGKIVHPKVGDKDRGEAYVGVFSNQRPKWQDQGADFYKEKLKETTTKAMEDLQDQIDSMVDDLDDNLGGFAADTIKSAVDQAVSASYQDYIKSDDWLNAAKAALSQVTDILVPSNIDQANQIADLEIQLKNLQRIWPNPLPRDYFADRDWYVKGKNVWIIQVGSRAEFGDFQTFKNRVSSARIHLDDVGDMECTYDIPRPDGSSDRLRLAYGSGGEFGLNGSPFQTDLYPRFENPFLRGGSVQWGQREYVIEYRGKSLLHDFSSFDQTVRQEQPMPAPDEWNTVKALVIFLKTGDTSMDGFTVATADVGIGCDKVAEKQVVAAGLVNENTYHDAEWIFFDFPASSSPDMFVTLTHPPSSKGDSTPHWEMSFTLFALMGDRVLRSCSLSGTYFEFKDNNRTTNILPFSIALAAWRRWETISNHKSPIFWMLARHPVFTKAYYDYSDLLAIDPGGRLWHRRLMSCAAEETGWFAVTEGPQSRAHEPDLSGIFFAAAVSAMPATLYLAVQSLGTLFARQPSPSGEWTEEWTQIDVWSYPDKVFGLPDTSGAPIPVALGVLSPVAGIPSTSPFGGAEITVLGADGNFYSRITSQPADIGAWRKIDVSGFTALFGEEFVVTGDYLLVLANDRSLWAALVDHSGNHASPAWERVMPADVAVSRFTATSGLDSCPIVVVTTAGAVRAATYRSGSPTAWVAIDLPNVAPAPGSALAATCPSTGQAKFFAIGADARVYSIDWDYSADWTAGKNWAEVAPNGAGIEALTGGGIATVSRVSGQVEIYAQSRDRSLAKAWWS